MPGLVFQFKSEITLSIWVMQIPISKAFCRSNAFCSYAYFKIFNLQQHFTLSSMSKSLLTLYLCHCQGSGVIPLQSQSSCSETCPSALTCCSIYYYSFVPEETMISIYSWLLEYNPGVILSEKERATSKRTSEKEALKSFQLTSEASLPPMNYKPSAPSFSVVFYIPHVSLFRLVMAQLWLKTTTRDQLPRKSHHLCLYQLHFCWWCTNKK